MIEHLLYHCLINGDCEYYVRSKNTIMYTNCASVEVIAILLCNHSNVVRSSIYLVVDYTTKIMIPNLTYPDCGHAKEDQLQKQSRY